MSETGKNPFDVVVLGAGVIGLSAALELVNRGFRPVIVARDLPEDSDSVGFASPWAGCNWYPFDTTSTTPSSLREITTFTYLADLARARPELCERIPFASVWDEEKPPGEEDVWFRDIVGDYRTLAASSPEGIPGGKKHGRAWTAFILHAPNYLRYLSALLREAGVPMVRQRLSSIDEAYTFSFMSSAAPSSSSSSNAAAAAASTASTQVSVRLVVNAPGLGARSLVGIEDPLVHPARGQTVLVRAPGCASADKRRCVMHTEGFYAKEGIAMHPLAPLLLTVSEKLPDPAYIIPRPNPTNSPDLAYFVCGGTYLPHEHDTLPDLVVAERILKDVYRLMPELASTRRDDPRGDSSGAVGDSMSMGGTADDDEGWKRIEVVSHNVGLRPAREGGARVELERRRIGDRPTDQVGPNGARGLAPRVQRIGEEVGVVHAYGFGSAGYQQSWGAALQVADLVEQFYSAQATASS